MRLSNNRLREMRAVLTCGAAVFLFNVTLTAANPSPKADEEIAKNGVYILEYDKKGRPKGIRRIEPKEKKKKRQSKEFEPGQKYVKGEVLAVNPRKGFRKGIQKLGFSILQTITLRELSLDMYRLRLPRGSTVESVKKRRSGWFSGVTVDANHIYGVAGRASFESQVPARIELAKTLHRCGRGVRIGMIDGGIDPNHPALDGQNIDYRSFIRKGRKPGHRDHGTAVSAILVGKPSKRGGPGILPGAELVAANIFEVNDQGVSEANTVGLVRAIDWMVSKRVRVLNFSIAGADNKVLRGAVKRAQKKGVVLVAAAGNWGNKKIAAYPAAYKEVIAVTSVGKGKRPYPRANQGRYIDFAAPGTAIVSARPGTGRQQSGTSFAAPYITGLVALEIARGANKDPRALRKLLRRQVTDLGAPGKDVVFGWGLVNVVPKCD